MDFCCSEKKFCDLQWAIKIPFFCVIWEEYSEWNSFTVSEVLDECMLDCWRSVHSFTELILQKKKEEVFPLIRSTAKSNHSNKDFISNGFFIEQAKENSLVNSLFMSRAVVKYTCKLLLQFFVRATCVSKLYIPRTRQAGCWYISDMMWEKELEQYCSIKHIASIILRMDQWVRMRRIPLNPGTATHMHLSSIQLWAILRE